MESPVAIGKLVSLKLSRVNIFEERVPKKSLTSSRDELTLSAHTMTLEARGVIELRFFDGYPPRYQPLLTGLNYFGKRMGTNVFILGKLMLLDNIFFSG